MNRAYKVVFNHHTQTYVAVSELATAHGKTASSGSEVLETPKKSFKKSSRLIAGALSSFVLLLANPAWAANYVAGGGSATGGDAIAIGTSSVASASRGTAIGVNSTAETMEGAVAVGYGSQVPLVGGGTDYRGGVAVGIDAHAISDSTNDGGKKLTPVAIGNMANALSDGAIAIGEDSNVTSGSTGAIALGSESSATVVGGVALGRGSVASTSAGSVGYDPATKQASTNTSSTWQSTTGAVSVGSGTTTTRQITSVAAGSLDTDAVNVAQLKAATVTVQSGSHTTVTSDTNANGGTDYTVNAATTAISPTTTTGKITVPTGTDLATSQDVANAINASGFTLTTSQSAGTATGTSNQLINPGSTVTFDAGKDIVLTQSGSKITIAMANNLTPDSVASDSMTVNPNGNFTVGADSTINMGNNNITNVASNLPATTDSTTNQAAPTTVTSSNAATVGDILNSGWNLQSNGSNVDFVKSYDTVNFTSSNKSVSITPTTTGTSSTLDFTVNVDGKTIVQNADGTISAVAPTATAPSTTTLTTNNGSVTAGDTTSLVTGDTVANAINNSGFNLTAQGTNSSLVKPSATVDLNNTDGNITVSKSATSNDVTFNLSKNLNVDTVSANTVTTGDTTINNAGVTINNGSAGNPVSLTKDGLDNGGNKITNVAAGTADNDAVNVSQLKSAQAAASNKVAAGDNIAVTSATNADGSTTYTVATAKDVTFDKVTAGPVTIDNSGINAGNTQVTNVASGGDVDTNAANIGDVKKATAAAKAEVVKGTNIASVDTSTAGDGHTVYTVNAKGTTVSAGSNAVSVVSTDTGSNVTNYAVDLSQSTKDDIQKGVDAKNAVDTKGLTFNADSGSTGVKKLGDSVAVTGDGNVKTTANADGVQVSLNKDLNVNSITIDGGTNGNVSLTNSGLNNGGNTITNVAPGVNDTDAVNVSQLNAANKNLGNDIANNRREARAGVAGAYAAASLGQVTMPGASMVSVGMGAFKGEGAIAIGASTLSDNNHWLFKANVSADTRKNYGAGVSANYQWR